MRVFSAMIEMTSGSSTLHVSCLMLSGEQVHAVDLSVDDSLAELESRIVRELEWECMGFSDASSTSVERRDLLNNYSQLIVKEIKEQVEDGVLYVF